MLYNEYHAWDFVESNQEEKNIQKKRFCDAKNYNRPGWMIEGQNLSYNRLCFEVHRLRNIPESGKHLEVEMRRKFKAEDEENNGNNDTTTFNGNTNGLHQDLKEVE